VFAFREILDGPAPVIQIVDAGAAAYGADPYAGLSKQGICQVIGFEPNKENCQKRNAARDANHTYLPYALGDGRVRRFYECNNPLTSSLYRPNSALLEKFSNLEPGIRVVAESEIQTHRLDDLAEIRDIDYLKLDVQGGELDVINGAQRLLETTLLVHSEVEFIPMYAEQPLFGDVDVALRRSGFWLHKLEGINGRVMKPLVPNNNPFAPLSQILWADGAVYVKAFMSFERLPAEKLLKLAIILHDVYSSWDLCALCVQHYDAKGGKGLWQKYLNKLVSGR
jgi:FkbM family methyltransferase